jgi:hypothetical protein
MQPARSGIAVAMTKRIAAAGGVEHTATGIGVI